MPGRCDPFAPIPRIVVALNEATYLTLVFPLEPLDGLRQRLATALEQALVGLGVAPDVARHEAVCIDFLPLTQLRNRKIASALSILEDICECERGCISDLRHVQFNLNDFPHGDHDPMTGREGVR